MGEGARWVVARAVLQQRRTELRAMKVRQGLLLTRAVCKIAARSSAANAHEMELAELSLAKESRVLV